MRTYEEVFKEIEEAAETMEDKLLIAIILIASQELMKRELEKMT